MTEEARAVAAFVESTEKHVAKLVRALKKYGLGSKYRKRLREFLRPLLATLEGEEAADQLPTARHDVSLLEGCKRKGEEPTGKSA